MSRAVAWAASWIWCRDSGIDKTGEFMSRPRIAAAACDRRVLFRKVFTLSDAPATAPLRITADSRYVAWVNAREVARGPARGHPSQLTYDTVDAAAALRAGTNVLAVLVRFYGRPNAWWMPAVPTFSHGAGVLVAQLELPGGELGTDGSWRCLVPDAWHPQEPEGVGQFFPEVLDARRLDPDWLTRDFDDSHWAAARVVTAIHLGGASRTRPPADPYGPLPSSQVPALVEVLRPAVRVRLRWADPPDPALGPVRYVVAADAGATGDAPGGQLPCEITLEPGAVAVLTVDWGQIVAGTLVLDLAAAAGTRVYARMCEELDASGRLPAHHHAHGVSYVCRGHADRFEAADPAGGRYVILVLAGAGPVRVRGVAVRERTRPRPEGAYFTCDDETVNQIYRTGLRTVDLTARDAYIDCPTREQRAWVGDSVVHQSVDLLTNPDWRLARWHPQLAASPRPDGMLPMAVACDFESQGGTYIPDWALHWIRSVHQLYRWTGDRELVGRLLPVAENVLHWFDQFVQHGLLTDVTGWVLLDWASVQGSGTSAVLNGLWGRALRDFAAMSRWLADAGRSAWALRRHAALARAYQVFWDTGRGGYRDWMCAAVMSPYLSEHATAAAAAGGLVPTARRASALRFLLDRDRLVRRAWSFGTLPLRAAMGPPRPDWDVRTEVVAAQPFFRYVVHDAVAELGGAEHIAALCRDWTELLDASAGTWPETWLGGSRCHGWSATPSRDLPLYTLGVSPAEPGFVVANVAPRPGNLACVAGAVPTPHGPLEVRLDGGVDGGVEVRSPVPFDLDLGGARERHPAGRWCGPMPRATLARNEGA